VILPYLFYILTTTIGLGMGNMLVGSRPADAGVEGSVSNSVVLPVFNEEQNICNYFENLRLVHDSSFLNYELIFVNGGNTT